MGRLVYVLLLLIVIPLVSSGTCPNNIGVCNPDIPFQSSVTAGGITFNNNTYGANASGYVPYTGATSNVDLGNYNLTTTGTGTFGQVTLTGDIDVAGSASFGRGGGSTFEVISQGGTFDGRVGGGYPWTFGGSEYIFKHFAQGTTAIKITATGDIQGYATDGTTNTWYINNDGTNNLPAGAQLWQGDGVDLSPTGTEIGITGITSLTGLSGLSVFGAVAGYSYGYDDGMGTTSTFATYNTGTGYWTFSTPLEGVDVMTGTDLGGYALTKINNMDIGTYGFYNGNIDINTNGYITGGGTSYIPLAYYNSGTGKWEIGASGGYGSMVDKIDFITSISDGTASWTSNSLSGFTSISGTTLTDGTAILTGGALTGVTVNSGITDSSSYWLCTASDCSTTCQVSIVGGAITGCV